MKTVPFVLQTHDAYRAGKHYDLRLQYPGGGKLKSWALTKYIIPKNPGDRVLAVNTPDHSKTWLRFQGEIPKGEYGGGTVRITQRGTAEILQWYDKVITFKITGRPLNGKYALVKYQTLQAKNKADKWLLVKAKDE